MNFSLLWTLFIEFFKTGLFALGGGLATIPFLYEMMDTYHWFTTNDLMNMIAVSESTPGAMGVNMATYVGYQAMGNSLIGGIVTTIGLVTPSVIVICVVAKFLKAFKESHWVQDFFYGLRPAVTAMIATAGLGVFVAMVFPNQDLSFGSLSISWIHLGFFALLFLGTTFYKKMHPIVMIVLCACIGILFSL
ncbi:chromate transporter [Dubosiella muris]|uniref:Chromate transporter n=1 Tax=Dubosiella muris TaxID=3038133 RepID=A0AC61R9E0_9FIRM|nr:chromate transporter [Dubosiella muris]TGY66895.1 chromate transporter [Dubosiella muris]